MASHHTSISPAAGDGEAPLHPTYRYVIDVMLRTADKGAKILDYGCGAGEIVVHGRKAGLDIVGADVFYDGGKSRKVAKERGLLDTIVFDMPDNRLPFDDDSFDMVCSNFVFEHVQDIEQAMSEVRRVLKPGGAFLNLLPTIGVLREGHCGVPFAHWLNGMPKVQTPYLLAWRTLGFGHNKQQKSRRQWARDFSQWLGDFTVYRSKRAIYRAYRSRFDKVERLDADFLAYRLELRGMRGAAKLARLRGLSWASRTITFRLAGTILLAT
jgi:SAM-dependent methyltransferase